MKKYHVHAIPEKAQYEIRFPRVEGYTQAIRNRIAVDWDYVPTMSLWPDRIPSEVEIKGLSLNNAGRMSLAGPGKLDEVNLQRYRDKTRLQAIIFDLAKG